LAAAETKASGTCQTGIFIAKTTTNSYRFNTAQCRFIQIYVGTEVGEQSKRDSVNIHCQRE